MILGQSWWKDLRDYRKYGPEEHFYWKLSENRFYPFEDLGNGFYYLRFRPTSFTQGVITLLIVALFTILYQVLVGNYPLPTFMSICAFVFGLNFLYGNLCTRELIISRLGGYVIRLSVNKKVLAEQEIYNIYIRLQRGIDSLYDFHFYLVIGGYLLDDIQISRFGSNEYIMRQMGRRLARNLGINYFDYDDITSRHAIYHYKGYSRLRWKQTDLAQLFSTPWSMTRDGEAAAVQKEKTTQQEEILKKKAGKARQF